MYIVAVNTSFLEIGYPFTGGRPDCPTSISCIFHAVFFFMLLDLLNMTFFS